MRLFQIGLFAIHDIQSLAGLQYAATAEVVCCCRFVVGINVADAFYFTFEFRLFQAPQTAFVGPAVIARQVNIFIVSANEHWHTAAGVVLAELLPCFTAVAGVVELVVLHTYKEVLTISMHGANVVVVSFWSSQSTPFAIFV